MGRTSSDNSYAPAIHTPIRSLESEVPDSSEAVSHTRPSAETADTLAAMTEVAVHEIGNVLGWLKMSLDLARRELESPGLPSPLHERLAPVLGNACLGVDHIANIVRGLRDVQRPLATPPGPFDPTEALRAAIRIAGPRIDNRAKLVEEIWPVPLVQGRKHDLVCVFLNLLLNAAEAIPVGEQGHTVTVRAAVEPGGSLLFEIEDTGGGVPAEIADSIFEPHVTSRGAEGGSGIGLHVCQRIVREMGGTIGFEPRPDAGTRFWIVLPHACTQQTPAIGDHPDPDSMREPGRDPVTASRMPGSHVSAEASPARKAGPRKRPILVVDDDASVRKLLERELATSFEVISVADSEQAMAVLNEQGQALAAVVTDHDLGPGPSGLDLLEAVRRERLPCVRVLVSGDMHDDLEASLAAGEIADAAFGKPWPAMAVVRCVADLLDLTT